MIVVHCSNKVEAIAREFDIVNTFMTVEGSRGFFPINSHIQNPFLATNSEDSPSVFEIYAIHAGNLLLFANRPDIDYFMCFL